jgi:drug/metabolite transporter (DMT)-like permease
MMKDEVVLMLTLSEDKLKVSFRTSCSLMVALSIARGSSFLFSKHLLGSMEPLNLLGIRFQLAFLILFLLFSRKIITDVKANPCVIYASLLLGGVYFFCMAAELIGLQYTTASTCSFLENSAIVIVPILEAILLRRFPKPVIIVSTVITFIGIGLIVLRGATGGTSDGGGFIPGSHPGLGEILCMIAALTYAAAIIITDRVSKKYDPLTLGILYVGFMGLMGLAASFLFETPRLPQGGSEWLMLFVLAVLCTAFGFTIQPVAQKPLSSETAGIICAINPLTTAVLGWLLMGDALGLSGIVGAALILVGIILPNLSTCCRSADLYL